MQKIHDVKFDEVIYIYPKTTEVTPWSVGGIYYAGVCICLAKKDDKYYMGISQCNVRDAFSKKLARKISLGRAEKVFYKINTFVCVSKGLYCVKLRSKLKDIDYIEAYVESGLITSSNMTIVIGMTWWEIY